VSHEDWRRARGNGGLEVPLWRPGSHAESGVDGHARPRASEGGGSETLLECRAGAAPSLALSGLRLRHPSHGLVCVNAAYACAVVYHEGGEEPSRAV
jgi:hypothetical protein